MAAIGIILLVAGAILIFGIDAAISGIDLAAIGYILMAGGALALVVAAIRGAGWMSLTNRQSRLERHVSADGRHVVEESHTS
ncbi:MAG: DUF6458 family protein [Actinomycetota bacterium]